MHNICWYTSEWTIVLVSPIQILGNVSPPLAPVIYTHAYHSIYNREKNKK